TQKQRGILVSLMNKTWALAAAFAVSATVGMAQSETDDAETADQTATENGLSLGEPVQDGPQIGQQYISETFGDWSLRCIKTEADQDPCQLWQLLLDGDGNSVAEISINALEGQGRAVAGANLIAPLETSLAEQVTIRVDEGQGRQYPFAFCTQIGCVSRIGLTVEDITSFKAGAGAIIRIIPYAAPDQTVDLPMSLTGFTAAFNALSAG
ncbi:MAG: invasion associated locus B family protein, partial [Pseudomonadota bacterium]